MASEGALREPAREETRQAEQQSLMATKAELALAGSVMALVGLSISSSMKTTVESGSHAHWRCCDDGGC